MQGQVFRMLVHIIGANRILFIGRLKGYSVLAMAEAMPDDGKIIACVEVPYFGVNGQEALYDAFHGKKILETNSGQSGGQFIWGDIHVERLHAVGKHFDTVFIDADQREPANYYNFVLENHLLREDGVICMENTLMKGQVYLENIPDENVLAVRKLNTVINSDPCVEQAFLLQKQVVKSNVFWGYRRYCILDHLRCDGKAADVTGGGRKSMHCRGRC
ncbi:uncharacterized protein LOC112549449 [Alligator sinensis]|uniref:Uncharacterized protein LOC112549449 n=1 Tax=Alligator sinensis TaxID=38654 RepID=A0A3Q0G5P3_ALLSI|nr:uncharacterized protein LOC112549449 [Alligator sinensis]